MWVQEISLLLIERRRSVRRIIASAHECCGHVIRMIHVRWNDSAGQVPLIESIEFKFSRSHHRFLIMFQGKTLPTAEGYRSAGPESPDSRLNSPPAEQCSGLPWFCAKSSQARMAYPRPVSILNRSRKFRWTNSIIRLIWINIVRSYPRENVNVRWRWRSDQDHCCWFCEQCSIRGNGRQVDPRFETI